MRGEFGELAALIVSFIEIVQRDGELIQSGFPQFNAPIDGQQRPVGNQRDEQKSEGAPQRMNHRGKVFPEQGFAAGNAYRQRLELFHHRDVIPEFGGSGLPPVVAKVAAGITPLGHLEIDVQQAARRQISGKFIAADGHLRKG